MQLESFVAERWQLSRGERLDLLDASTAEVVAQTSAAAVDGRALLEHARAVGGPNLRALTFHERAGLLKALAKQLNEHRDELYQLSHATGATRSDSLLDIDGGISTLFVYASKGVRELPNERIYVEGAVEALSRGGTFVGQHICTPLEGAALHINAFNFPVWGMLEKLAPALLAGVAAIVKPATVSSYLAERMFRHIVAAGILPEGAVQLICGPVGDMLDHLTSQDVVCFTGSASTAQRLRTHPAILANSVRFTAETDSLNCAILGPDAVPGSPEFDLFVQEVAREMTVKAGQKCTAIRRALVPGDRITEVAEALGAKLTQTVVGDPRLQSVTMGPLASIGQQREVHAQLGRLQQEARTLLGAERAEPLGDRSRNGAFVFPTLLLCPEPRAARELHVVEAFGPVCTLAPYGSLAEAVELSRRGGGSLVSSMFTADEAVASQLVLGLAPFHGRLLVVNRDCAAESTGHGSPLPHLTHGGPGRAGGGEELGGIRGVLHYMQRTAVQGSPDVITAVTRRWVKGARRLDPGTHPFRKPFGALQVGDTFRSAEREVTLQDIERFAELSGDHFYAHMDEAQARRNPLFGGRVAHGYFLISAAAGLFVDPPYGPVLANYGIEGLRFTQPVRPGDRIRVRLTCKEKTLRSGADYGEVRWATEICNQTGATVAAYDVLTMVSEKAVPDA
jgi:oxepin-CoA hydrolase/3-oxo-5,6-dehydrosuberyl-CoA semialdehyde dehydrogenase